MAKYTTADVRNVALVGHGDAGKTTLADHLLATAGAVSRVGSVKEKTSVFDFDPEEREHGHSIDATVGHCTWKGKEINVIDCPGYPDFFGEAVTGLNGADLALICVSATAGVMVNTRRAWGLAVEHGRARAIVVTKTDQAEGQLLDVVESLRSAFGERCVPWRAPDSVGDFREAWTEAVVEADDDLMMRYLEGEAISDEERRGASRAAIAKGLVIPVLFTSAETGQGLEHLLDFLAERAPSPADVSRLVGPADDPSAEGEEVSAVADDPFIGHVWNLRVDRHVGKIAHVRIVTGALKPGDTFVNVRPRKKEKCGHVHRMEGKEQQELDAAVPGDLVVLTKVDSLEIGDTLSGAGKEIAVRAIPYPLPMYSLAITAKSRGEEGKIVEGLVRLSEECPTFSYHREMSTHEGIISGLSQLHLDIMLHRLKDRYGMEVNTSRPKVPYKEAITAPSDGHFRHKKQTGGRGQFAEVYLKVSPGEPGEGLAYSWDIFGGSIPTNFGTAIEKGIKEKMHEGIIAGYPLEDIKVSITDGKHHDVDSSEAAFKMAGGRAFADAVSRARPVLLEPIVKLEITIPGHYMGDVSGDLNTRRGRIQGMDQVGDYQLIRAEMPQAEAAEYSRALTSLTSGEGSYTVEPSHYENVPASLQQDLIKAFKPKADED